MNHKVPKQGYQRPRLKVKMIKRANEKHIISLASVLTQGGGWAAQAFGVRGTDDDRVGHHGAASRLGGGPSV